ncbi:putative protein N(5)-glutamine methyltransferase [Microlunatus flavus]|uniref:putative protein N(5)-glutamine methyltransferase n=1 Tax=Microlunatus flavus TaxID=1036181 RepID=UPI001E345351|nr:putative protein N(5)-glutamine methyltransferase [Microlunatus flavus]
MSQPATEEALVRRLRAAGCVFAEEEAALILEQAGTAADPAAEAERLAGARVGGLPLEVVLGWAELAGVRVVVEPGVFVPRRRTELMVATAVELGAARPEGPLVLLDLCCGSGAVAVAVTHGLGRRGRTVEVTAADLDDAAVRCAARNLPGARVLRSDLFADLPVDLQGRVDLLTANVPYVPTGAVALMPREAREHEPRMALDGGDDGLVVLRRVAAQAPAWLAPGGSLLVETSEEQEPTAVAVLADAGLDAGSRADDELGATVVVGTQPG